ncbi:MAG: hypothetical protein ACOH2L_02845 [Devosia sp.]
MKALQTCLVGAAMGLALMASLAAPALAQPSTPDVDTATPPAATAIDFGDDTSQWANDGECDDPRFAGAASATELLEADQGHDATDCRAAFAAGTIGLADPANDTAEPAAPPETTAPPATTDLPATADVALPDFGDDSSQWANDGECDDPRFHGAGSATELLDADRLHDATDCRTAFANGTVTLLTQADVTDIAAADNAAERIDFGDDSGQWANDGECDDPDFAGPGMTAKPSPESRMHDASDCRAAFEHATIAMGSAALPTATFDYGSDSSHWANDGECDDPRFEGAGTDKKLLNEDMQADASDCRALEADGQVSIRPVYAPGYAAGAPYDSTGLTFGDDSSDYAHDDQCDDPRFVGPGTASTLLEGDSEHDAADCRAAYEAGTVVFR